MSVVECRVNRHYLAACSSARRRRYFRPGLWLICLIWAIPLYGQFDCPPPWDSATIVYGIVTLDGSGNGSAGDYTQSVNQHAIAAGKLAAPVPGACQWQAIPFVGLGQMTSQAHENDTVTYIPNGTFFNWSASGTGDPLWDNISLQIIPSMGRYVVGAFGAVPGQFDSNGTITNEDIIWGAANTSGGVSEPNQPFPAGAPFLFGAASYQSPPLDNAQGNPGLINANWNVTWMFTAIPDGTCKDCVDHRGSLVSTRNQSLGEDIPIVGTGFFLHYESQRTAGRAGADPIAVRDAMSLGGWTLSVHHALEPLIMAYCAGGSCTPYSLVPKALFLGDGSMRNSSEVQAPLVVGANLHVTSVDGSEIYVFDGQSFRHTQTLLPMTGTVLYNFGYDSSGLLATVTDGNGNVTTIQRDANGHPTAIVSPYGQTTALSVDGNGYLSQVSDPMGHAITLTSTALGLLTSFKDADGNLYNFQYDGNGFLTQDSDPAGGIINLARTDNSTGYTVTETTAEGRTNSGQIAFSNTASSTAQQFTNTWPSGLQASESDTQQNGSLTESASLPDGTAYSKTFGPDPRWGIQLPTMTSASLTRGSLTMNVTNSRTASLSDPADPFSLTTLTDTTTVNGRTSKSVFTASTKTFVNTSAGGRVTTTTLDALERVSSVAPPGVTSTTFTYDSRGRLASLTQGTRVATFTYDANGHLATVTDPLNLSKSFAYDADGRVLSATLPDGRVVNYSYDANGNITSVTPPGAPAHGFAYSAVNLSIAYNPPAVSGGGSTTYSYSPDREITEVTRPDGQVVNYNYDAAGRLTSLVAPSSTFNFTYDAATGNLTSASIPGGESIAYSYNGPLPTGISWTGTVAGAFTRTFNNNFWEASQSINGTNAVNFTYDKDGLVSKAGVITLKHNAVTGLYTGGTLGSAKDTIAYSGFAERKTYTAKYIKTVLYKVNYTRDNAGRIVTMKDTIGGTVTTYTYKYDRAGRLTEVDSGTAKAKEVLASYSYDGNSNRLSLTTPSGTLNATYDGQDRLLTYGNAAYTYTANGELATKTVSSQLTTYQYDVFGNLTAAVLPDGTQITYILDAENNRVGKKVNGMLVEGFLYDGTNVVAQLDASNQVVSRFVYGNDQISPSYMIRGGVTYRIFSDHLGSPRLVVDSATGNIAERIDYDEFGNVVNDTNPGFQPFGFGGGLYDSDTRLVRFDERDYDPSIGRWTAKDPVRFDGGDTNLYGYVLNDPINMIDPTGLEGTCPCEKKPKGPNLEPSKEFTDKMNDKMKDFKKVKSPNPTEHADPPVKGPRDWVNNWVGTQGPGHPQSPDSMLQPPPSQSGTSTPPNPISSWRLGPATFTPNGMQIPIPSLGGTKGSVSISTTASPNLGGSVRIGNMIVPMPLKNFGQVCKITF